MQTVLWWHFHQPDYRRPEGGTAALPWVRMHALRAYTDLPELVLQTGLGPMTFNLVPSLGEQLLDASAGDVVDDMARCFAMRTGPRRRMGHSTLRAREEA